MTRSAFPLVQGRLTFVNFRWMSRSSKGVSVRAAVLPPDVGVVAFNLERQSVDRDGHEDRRAPLRFVWEDVRDEEARAIVDGDEQHFPLGMPILTFDIRQPLRAPADEFSWHRPLITVGMRPLATLQVLFGLGKTPEAAAELGLYRLDADVAAGLCEQYDDQPLGEIAFCAMDPIETPTRVPRVFCFFVRRKDRLRSW